MTKKAKLTIHDRVLTLLENSFSKRIADVYFDKSYTQIVSQGTTAAVNDFGHERYEVKATPWFGNYWFFIRIQFKPGKWNVLTLNASVSFFQKTNTRLKQLFRAEWDGSYDEVEGYNHPQPHWHFTAQLSDITQLSDLEKCESDEEESIYNKLLGNSNSLSLDRMHFAMAGSWPSDGDMLGKADEIALVDWLINLFIHVREELIYKERTKDHITI